MLPKMEELLEKAGFVVRGRRAKCAHCSGRTPLTVSVSEEVAYCFRCQWRSSRLKLAKEIGIISERLTPEERKQLAEETKAIAAKQQERASFLAWQRLYLNKIIYDLRALNQKAFLARQVLSVFPEEDLAWQALANLYNAEARLFAAYDYFAHVNVSDWLEQESTLQVVFALYKHEQTRRNR